MIDDHFQLLLKFIYVQIIYYTFKGYYYNNYYNIKWEFNILHTDIFLLRKIFSVDVCCLSVLRICDGVDYEQMFWS